MTLQAENALIFNTTATKRATLAKEIDVARHAGFSGIETTAAKILSYLDAGHSVSDLKATLAGLPIYGIGTVLNIERHGDDARSLISDARTILELAHRVGARRAGHYRPRPRVKRFREGEPKRITGAC